MKVSFAMFPYTISIHKNYVPHTTYYIPHGYYYRLWYVCSVLFSTQCVHEHHKRMRVVQDGTCAYVIINSLKSLYKNMNEG